MQKSPKKSVKIGSSLVIRLFPDFSKEEIRRIEEERNPAKHASGEKIIPDKHPLRLWHAAKLHDQDRDERKQ